MAATTAAAEATATVALDVAAAAMETRATVLTPTTAAAATNRRPHSLIISLSALCALSAIILILVPATIAGTHTQRRRLLNGGSVTPINLITS